MPCDDLCRIVDPPTLVPFGLPASMEELVKKRMALIEGLMARSMVDLGYPPGALTLYEESKPADGMGMKVLYKWWVGVDPKHSYHARPETVIKKFLQAAQAHYEAEASRAAEEYKHNPGSAHAKKAVEGARWTAYHTKTLLRFLAEKGPMQYE